MTMHSSKSYPPQPLTPYTEEELAERAQARKEILATIEAMKDVDYVAIGIGTVLHTYQGICDATREYMEAEAIIEERRKT